MKESASVFLSVILLLISVTASAQPGPPGKKAIEKAAKAELAAGKNLYTKYSCVSCHGPTGAQIGDLTMAYRKYNDEQLRSYITNPRQYGNMKMPVFSGVIAEADFRPLMAYVRWLGENAVKEKK